MPFEKLIADPCAGGKLASLQVQINQPQTCASAGVGDEIERDDAMKLRGVVAGRFKQSGGLALETSAVHRQPFFGPFRQPLLNSGRDAGVLVNLVVLVGLRGHDPIGVAPENLLIDVGGLVPFPQVFHPLGQRELLHRHRRIADVDALGGIAAVEALGVDVLRGKTERQTTDEHR